MAPVRVRGCAGPTARLAPASGAARQADASRRRNGPRKATSRRPITVRLRSKSCPDGGPDVLRPGRRGVVAVTLRDPQQGGGGGETRSGGGGAPTDRAWGGAPRCRLAIGGATSWATSSKGAKPR